MVDDEVVHRPALALLADDHTLESTTASRALTLRPGSEAGEHLRDRLARPGRRDAEGVPGPRRHGRIGRDDAHRGLPVAVHELVQEELRGQENGDLARRGGIDDGDALVVLPGQIDQGEYDLVDPAQVDPLRAVTVLEHEPPLAGDADQASEVLVFQERRVQAGHGAARHRWRGAPPSTECTPAYLRGGVTKRWVISSCAWPFHASHSGCQRGRRGPSLLRRAGRRAPRTGAPSSRQRGALHRCPASRWRLAASLSSHHCRFCFGTVPCCGQPCQKHPSTYTATRSVGNTTSDRRRLPLTGRSTEKRSPMPWRADRSASSGLVSRRLVLVIRVRISSLDAAGTPFGGAVQRPSPAVDVRGVGRRGRRPAVHLRQGAQERLDEMDAEQRWHGVADHGRPGASSLARVEVEEIGQRLETGGFVRRDRARFGRVDETALSHRPEAGGDRRSWIVPGETPVHRVVGVGVVAVTLGTHAVREVVLVVVDRATASERS